MDTETEWGDPAQPAPDLSAVAAEMEAALESAIRVDHHAKRARDGRVFVDFRDWEAFLFEARAALASYHAAIGKTGGQDARD